MDDFHEAEDRNAEKEAEATADDASLTTKTIKAETPVKDASDATKDQTPEAEATAKDASQSAKASSSSAEAEQSLGKASYEALVHASSSNLEQGLVTIKQPIKIGAPPRPSVSAAEAERIAATTAGAALSTRDPHLLMTVVDNMACSADVFASNAKTNAAMMKGTAQVFIFYLSIFHTYIPL